MEYGAITIEREKSVRLLEGGIRFFLTAALTASQTPGQYAPFALGSVAAAGTGNGAMASLAGTVVGAVLFLDFGDALPFLAVALLILTCAVAFRGTKLMDKPAFMPVVTGGLVLAVGGIYAAQALSPAEQLASCIAAAGLAGAAAWFFRPLLQPASERREEGLLFLAAALLLAIQDILVAGLSLGRILLSTLLLYISYERGAMTGTSAGLGLGLVADLCAGTGTGLFTAGFGLAGLGAGSQSGRSRITGAAAFLGAALLSLLPATDPLAPPLVMEVAVGTGCFLLLPRKAFGGKRVQHQAPSETVVGARLKEQMLKTAAAFRDLYDSMGRSTAVNDENPAIVFDRAAEKVCRDCALCTLCWQKEYTGTFNALNDATPYLLERGRAMQKDFPGYFTERCIHLSEFIIAVNGELSAFLLRRQYRRQLEETRRSAQGQYAQLSELLTATAAGLGAVTASGGKCAAAVGAALRAKEGETVCGDTMVSFTTDRGQWCLLLADGMGSGEAARRESALTCRLLRQFLEAGIEPEAALKTLNAAMALRGAETGSFTTVDLCQWDGVAGEAVFYKYGAAPSYLKKGGVVRRITGVSLPVGLRGAPALPDVTRVAMEPGTFAVMISDGVADADRDDWLQNLLAGWPGEDPQALADLVLAESVRREQLRDDCAVQVLYLPPAEKKGARAV